MRILVEIAYQGNNFLGFQIQQNGRTVQQQFESYYNACIKDM
ncbi:tRNA pseudouridine synthase A [Staphylococcus aureus]|uniref:tRNA pseudouridine synthase A n=1 Tax=Staphylococcus aureus TaxID=1280 RepID=A0A380ENB9_STAAU|nr:tRNA pseudouridine synthase A [Staphylococcus aureus]